MDPLVGCWGRKWERNWGGGAKEHIIHFHNDLSTITTAIGGEWVSSHITGELCHWIYQNLTGHSGHA